MLVALTEEFASCFAAEKKRKNLVDFSDMEHFALKILVDQTTKEPTETADEFAALFDEIMIDEYQDSNYVQETLLRAVSKERFGQNNLLWWGCKAEYLSFPPGETGAFHGKIRHLCRRNAGM